VVRDLYYILRYHGITGPLKLSPKDGLIIKLYKEFGGSSEYQILSTLDRPLSNYWDDFYIPFKYNLKEDLYRVLAYRDEHLACMSKFRRFWTRVY
jgi:hypothetical protein